MADVDDPLKKFVSKLSARANLAADDAAALLQLPYVLRTYEPATYLVREGEPAKRACSFVLSGFAYRQKLTANGSRQILSLHLPGDLLDLQQLFLRRADHSVQALTRLTTAEIERDALHHLTRTRPTVSDAMWVDALIEASILREWILNVGRRDARGRIAHLLCEFATRMDQAGLSDGARYELPMTQEQIGDATGLTGVHVNRTLKSLTDDGLVHRDKRYLSFSDWDAVRAVADFSSLYLHADQLEP
ncbi:MAG: Crp/Fnr family transcriptional regulator [Alphaproteobacteria bacterium]|nr:MAG: Crp/Fnr family transcriptional regulator [Alphaproteobacteria bacterium]